MWIVGTPFSPWECEATKPKRTKNIRLKNSQTIQTNQINNTKWRYPNSRFILINMFCFVFVHYVVTSYVLNQVCVFSFKTSEKHTRPAANWYTLKNHGISKLVGWRSKKNPALHPNPSKIAGWVPWFLGQQLLVKLVASLKLTFSPLKMDGWNTILSYWVSAYFQGLLLLVSGRVHQEFRTGHSQVLNVWSQLWQPPVRWISQRPATWIRMFDLGSLT